MSEEIDNGIIQRLRVGCAGKDVWRVRDKDRGAYCIQFEAWEEFEAKQWWKEHKDHEHYSRYELEKVRIQSQEDLLMQEAADMLEFFFSQMQMHSPKMNGSHSWRLRGGWPMTHAIGPSAEEAIRAAVAEVKRSQKEMSEVKG